MRFPVSLAKTASRINSWKRWKNAGYPSIGMQGIETLLANGKRNPASGIMLALLAEMARSEVELLRERINSGLDEARRKGVKLGRPEGTTLDREVFLQKHKEIVRLLKAGQSVRNAAKIASKGISTVQRVKRVLCS